MSHSGGRGRWIRGLLIVATVVLAAGCNGGDDGKDGAEGPRGLPGPRGEAPKSLAVTITNASVDSPAVIDFEVKDGNGLPFTDLTADAVNFTFSKLVPGTNGDTNRWQTYIRGNDGGVTNAQSTTYSSGTLENHGDGTYTYTFTDNLQDISGVTFEPELTHRVGMEIRDAEFGGEEIPGTDVTYNFQPSTGATEGIATRKVIAQASCASCHGTKEFAFHGGPRQSVDLCVTCHQPGSIDVQTGNTMDFRVMIHKIHMGENLPSVEDGGDYAFCGFGCDNFGSPPTSFAEVVFPQDQRNCVKCHDPDNGATPDAVNIVQHPSMEACGACHDDVDFAQGEAGGHPGGVVTDNSECTTCHAEGRVAGSVLESHTIESQVAAARFKYNILQISDTAPGQTPKIKFSVTDPTNGNAAYDVLNDPEFDSGNGASMSLNLAWPTTDYDNFDPDAGVTTGSPPARVPGMSLIDPAHVASNGDGTFTLTSTIAIPVSLEGSGAVAMEGHPVTQLDGEFVRAPVTGEVEYFAVTDATPQARRQVVDVAKCQNCHGRNDGLSLHGGNRTDKVQLCVMCHNSNNTDLGVRPTDPDGVNDGHNSATVDGLEERSIDFKHMIHAIHGAGHRENDFIIYGFRSSVHNFGHVEFPRGPNECDTCHVGETYAPPLGSNVLATTVDTRATVGEDDFVGSDGNPIEAGDPRDDGNITATAAVCSACHDEPEALAHMRDVGGAGITDEAPGNVSSGPGVVVTQTDVDNSLYVESCGVCHGSGRDFDVSRVHGLTE